MEDDCGIVLENVVKEHTENEESTKIGLSNIKKMMGKMCGECRIEERNNLFIMTLLFKKERK